MAVGDKIASSSLAPAQTAITKTKIKNDECCGGDSYYFVKSCKQSEFTACGCDNNFAQNIQSSLNKDNQRNPYSPINHLHFELVLVVTSKASDTATSPHNKSVAHDTRDAIASTAVIYGQFSLPEDLARDFPVFNNNVTIVSNCAVDTIMHIDPIV